MASSPLDPASPGDIFQPTLNRLLTHLRVSPGNVLLLAVADDPRTHQIVTARLIEEFPLTRFTFAEDPAGLLEAARRVAPRGHGLVADGLSDLSDAGRRQAMLTLNLQRGALMELARPLVLWVAEAHLNELQTHAGDFWVWHTAQYHFPGSEVRPWLMDRNLLADDDRVLGHYLRHVRDQHRHMPLPLARRGDLSARADVELAEVFVPLTLREPTPIPQPHLSSRKIKKREMREGEQEAARPATLGEVLARYPAFLLRGAPGCGKTTLLRRAALAFAEGEAQTALGWDGPALLPLFLRLRNFGLFLESHRAEFPRPMASALTMFIESFFRDEHGLALTPNFFERRLAEGNCLILLDGLDEVATHRDLVAQCVNAFVRRYAGHGNHFGLSSRPAGYEAVAAYLREAELMVAEVNPLNRDGVEQLVSNLIQLIESNSTQRARDAADLPRRLFESPALVELAGIPLFCTTLVLVYKYHGAQLPQRRVEVYQEIVDLLLGFWRAQQRELFQRQALAQDDGTGEKFADLSQAVALKKRRLAHLALWMQTNRLTDAPLDQTKGILFDYLRTRERKDPATAAVWAVNFLQNAHEHSGLFVAVEEGRYAFAHQGFREYLAATALIGERDFVAQAVRHARDDWWEQVLWLAGAHPALKESERADLLVELLRAAQTAPEPKARHTYLLRAGQCAVDMGGYLPGPERELVESALLHLMRDTDENPPGYPNDKPLLTSPTILPPQTRLEAGLILDSLGWPPPDLDTFVPIPNTPCAIGQYPVTNLQYQRFLDDVESYNDPTLWQSIIAFDAEGKLQNDMGAGAEAWEWFKKNGGKDRKPGLWDDARFGATRRLLPVVGVTWYEAAAYCAWLNRNPPPGFSLPPGWVFRLPTETEWLTAAGGIWKDSTLEEKTPRYPWQKTPAEVTEDEIVKYANTISSNLNGTSPVGMYPAGASLLGLLDMAGNVWEWQANLFEKDEVYRAVRGGSWYDHDDGARAAARLRNHPYFDWYDNGFRVVAAPG